ncbi:hypothetical protein GEMRC1_011146 [Eukaryota sp. GEM-RC1]
MALAVQQKLELMAPELNDYKNKSIFSDQEIRYIVDKRRHFELQLKKRPPSKVDFLHVIRYELQLDHTRNTRKQQLSLKSCPSDFCIVRRIFSLFHRATLRFSGDIQLWLSYLTFCLRKGAFKRIALVFGRALALHPNSTGIWLLAAQYEYLVQHSHTATRAVFSKALEANPTQLVLYEEWLKMELDLIKALREAGRFEEIGVTESTKLIGEGQHVMAVVNQVIFYSQFNHCSKT